MYISPELDVMFVSCVYTKQTAASFTHSLRTPGVFLDYCVSPLSRLHVPSPYQTKNVSVSKCKTYCAHTNPEGFKAVLRAKDESDAETLDGKLPFAAKKTLTYMITKGNYFLSICIGKN